MNDKDENERYFDFTDQDEILDGYRTGSSPEWQKALAEGIQNALRRNNPIQGIKELIAFQIGTQAMQSRERQKLLSSMLILLFVNTVLLLIIIYFMFNM